MENFFNVSTWANDVDYGCSALNKTVLLIHSYSGIPETLLLNVLAWILLLILFTILRHQAGDYGRLALINNNGNRKRWTEVFYSCGNNVDEHITTTQPHVMNNMMAAQSSPHTSSDSRHALQSSTNHTNTTQVTPSSVHDDGAGEFLHDVIQSACSNTNVHGNKNYSTHWTEAFYNSGGSNTNEQLQLHSQTSQSLRSNGATALGNDMESQAPHNEPHDKGLFSWIIITLKLRKEQIFEHTGPDAIFYLSYQQHLIVVMAIVTAVSLVIILPVNFLNGPDDDDYDVNTFGRTTMANLTPDSHWLWIHVFVAITYAPLIVLIMRLSSGRNAFKKAPTRTLMITNIGTNDRNKTIIRHYIQELFSDITIEDVQVAHNISKLYGCNASYERALEARIYCQNHRDRDTLMLRPTLCSCEKMNAYEYYEKQERTLSGDVARLRASALNEPLDIAFVTVSTVQEAQNIIKHFKPTVYRKWKIEFAPSPDDLFWENLNVSRGHWMLKWATINILLFIALFFLTTPAMIVNFLDSVALIKDSISTLSPLISEFLPTLMLWTLSVLMPVIVTYSDKWMCYFTRSQLNYSIMTKCFGYLLLMILILPSLGLASAEALLLWSVSDEIKRWQCIFLPDRGSFYVNYIITAAFIGTALELLRFPELIVYMWMLLTAKSKAETPYIRKTICIEFPFGIHYAWTTLVFTIAIVYSVFCPLIMPFAMVYICFKHFVDRHNLYFAYGPSNMISRNGGKVHSTAVTMTKFSVVLLLLIMAMISYIRGAGLIRALVLLITLVITLTLFTFMSPIKRCTRVKRPSVAEAEGNAPIYIPDVLRPRPSNGSITLSTNVNNHLYNNTQNVLSGNVSRGLYGGFGSDNVSDFEVSSECSVNNIGA